MMLRKKNQTPAPIYPFCRQPWHVGAMLLGFGFVFTIVWAFHLLHDLGDDLSLPELSGKDRSERAGVTERNMLPVAMTKVAAPGTMDPATMRIRAGLVNIAGIRKANGTTPAQFVSAGSGMLVTANGYVATTVHVVADLQEILVRVQTPSGPRQYTARLVKTDLNHNLAILKLVSRDVFPYLPLVAENVVPKIGDPVVAWGDPSGTGAQINRGVVQRVDRTTKVGAYTLTHLIETGAVSQWSQSGGPLVDQQGQVLGINVVTQAAGGRIVGYAIPVDVLLAHFRDVVNFPTQSLGVAANRANVAASPGMTAGAAPVAGGPVVQPVAMTGQPAMTAYPGKGGGGLGGRMEGSKLRPADDWWAQALALYGMGTQPPFLGAVGVHVAANTPLPVVPYRAGGQYAPPQMVPVVHTAEQYFWGYSWDTLLGLLALGLISGISGGMMTMGGGIIKVTGLLLFFGYGMLLIRPVAYITNIFLYGAAVLRYRRYNLILWDSVRGLIPWAMVGVVLGYFIGNVIGTLWVHYLLGVFAALVGVRMTVEIATGREKRQRVEDLAPRLLRRKPAKTMLRYLGIGQVAPEDRPLPAQNGLHGGILGLPMGIISGILGITGGVVEVPLQRYVVGVPLRNAIANSAVLVFFASSVGSIVAMAHGIQTGAFDWSAPVKLAIVLIPGAYIGGVIGAWLTKIVPLGVLRWLYAVLMFVIAVRMFLS